MKKKFAMLVASMLAVTTVMGTAVVHAENVPEISAEEKIVMEAMGFSSIPSDFEYTLVSVDSGISTYSTGENSDAAKAIAVEKDLGNGIYETSYIYPYIETEDGLENSFAYVTGRSVGDQVWNLTDVTVTVATGYESTKAYEPTLGVTRYYYRVLYGAASWRKTNSSSSAVVDSIYLISAVKASKCSLDTFERIGFYEREVKLSFSSPIQNNRYTVEGPMFRTTPFLVADLNYDEYGGTFADIEFHTNKGVSKTEEIWSYTFRDGQHKD